MFEFLVSSHTQFTCQHSTLYPDRSSKGDASSSALSFCWDRFAFWHLCGSDLSHLHPYRGLWIGLWIWSAGKTFTPKQEREGALKPEMKENSSYCISSWPLRMYQCICTAGALISIPSCSKWSPTTYPDFVHRLNVRLSWFGSRISSFRSFVSLESKLVDP